MVEPMVELGSLQSTSKSLIRPCLSPPTLAPYHFFSHFLMLPLRRLFPSFYPCSG